MNDTDLIRRQDAANVVARWVLEDDILPLPEDYSYSLAESILNQVPSAENTGHWIRTKNPLNEEITICSECGTIIKQGYLDYCAKCGARMVGDTE